MKINHLFKPFIKILKIVIPSRIYDALLIGFRHWQRQRKNDITLRRNIIRVNELISKSEPIRLELGAGYRKIAGWTTVDNNGMCDITMTLRDKLPFPDGSIEEIYASHILEHFHHPELMFILSECHRVLRFGGKIRIVVPDAALYIQDYIAKDFSKLSNYINEEDGYFVHSPIDLVNLVAYDRYSAHEHGYMFDSDCILKVLSLAGFQGEKIRTFDEKIDLEERINNSLYAIAYKMRPKHPKNEDFQQASASLQSTSCAELEL